MKLSNCQNVRFGSNAIKKMLSIRELQLYNIRNLTLEDSSLSWDGYRDDRRNDDNLPSVTIKIIGTIIRTISSNTFKGIYDQIHFKNVIIDEIAQYAFSMSSTRTTRSITFVNTTFLKIQPQAFKKFQLDSMAFDGSVFHEIPSRGFSDLTIYDKFQMTNTKISVIRSLAFLIYQPRTVEIIGNEIDVTEGDGFKITTRGSVLFKNNVFNELHYGSFKGLSVNVYELHRKERIYFVNDTFLKLTNEFLNLNDSSFVPDINKINITFECDCKTIDLTFKDKTYYGEINCIYDGVKKQFINLKEFKDGGCSIVASNVTVIVIVSVVLILLIIVSSLLLFYYKKIYRSDRYGNSGDKNEEDKRKNISLIVPDGKTYKETELHVIVERADLLTTDL